MKQLFKYFLLLALISGVFSACDKDDEPCDDNTNPECPNFDPCWNKVVTADFKMRQTSPGFVVPEDLQAEWCDTILGSGVEFLADMDGALSYTWQVGTESTTRAGRRIVVSFSSYTQDTLQNLNPDNPDYYLPLNVVLTVRNEAGPCIAESDTVLTITRQLVFARKSLTQGTFRGRVEGESFDRDVIFWKVGEDLDNPQFNLRYFTMNIGLPPKDTLFDYWIWSSGIQSKVTSYKEYRWNENSQQWWIGTDGVQEWDQKIITSHSGPDRVDLTFKRYPEDNSGVQIVRFSGERIE